MKRRNLLIGLVAAPFVGKLELLESLATAGIGAAPGPVTAALSVADRLRVVRLMRVIEPKISEALSGFIFEPNDGLTQVAVVEELGTLFDNPRLRPLLDKPTVTCDDTNNPAELIEVGKLRVDIGFTRIAGVKAPLNIAVELGQFPA